MAKWLGQEKRVPMVIVELQVEAMRRLARQEISQAHSAEQAAPYLAADEQPAQAILRWVALPLAGQAWQ